jgi:hypothetical protein
MIARIWHGMVSTSKGAEYLDLMRRFALPEYLATRGNRGAWCLYRTEAEVTHFEMLTFGTWLLRRRRSLAHISVPLLEQRIGECCADRERCCFEILNRAHFIADVNLEVFASTGCKEVGFG